MEMELPTIAEVKSLLLQLVGIDLPETYPAARPSAFDRRKLAILARQSHRAPCVQNAAASLYSTTQMRYGRDLKAICRRAYARRIARRLRTHGQEHGA